MAKKMSYHRLHSLWKTHSCDIRLTEGSVDAYLKKSMDDICFQAELAETNWEYTYIICQGMKRLIKMGAERVSISKHHNLMQKLLYLGRDLMQTSSKHSDLFYLGIFIELKIYSKWKYLEFYDFLLNALKAIKKDMQFITEKMKSKLSNKLQLTNKRIYQEFFLEPTG